MPNKIILKKSSVASKVPTTTDLDYGELAINYADGKLYYKKSDGTTIDAFISSSGTIPSTVTVSSETSPFAWNSDSYIQYSITTQATSLTINADSGTPVNAQKMTFRIKDDGTARSLTWTTGVSKSFRVIGVTLPTTTIIGKTLYVGCIYNLTDSRWDVVAIAQE